jgi:LPPG:FO 2-phospho-L-lactate transferase
MSTANASGVSAGAGAPGQAVVALCGGVGGAKLAVGLDRVAEPHRLAFVVNTADDFDRYGLHVSPDVDTVLYSLAGIADPETGWGVDGDSDRVMSALASLGDDVWFRLGDRDLATHLLRTGLLKAGHSLGAVTERLAGAYGIRRPLHVMSDQAVRTEIVTRDGPRQFQEWFVRDRCRPPALAVTYRGAGTARLSDGARAALSAAEAVVLAPSNPYLSIDPILALRDARSTIAGSGAVVVAVSPIVGGRAVKGPLAEMLVAIQGESSSLSVARHYGDLVDWWVIHDIDADQAVAIEDLGHSVTVTDTLMRDTADKVRLAAEVYALTAAAASGRGSRTE